MLAPRVANLASPPREAAVRLDDAFRTTHGRRLHLAPLDLAPELPSLRFGPAKVSKFLADELRELIDPIRLQRLFPHNVLDLPKFAQFHWMLVEEHVSLDQEPDVRAMPLLFINVGDDLGIIEPHQGRWPRAFEDALFVLLLAPWEDWSEMPDVNWRGFEIRWMHTKDEDIFVRQHAPPLPDTLSWEPYVIEDRHGGMFEDEQPLKLRLADRAYAELQKCDNTRWRIVEEARRSHLFETPIVHFFLRAFASEGIDEFLAHVTTIEAAVGVHSDHDRRLRTKPDPHNGLSATQRVAARMAGLLGNAQAARQYRDLFDVRSAYLHGRTMKPISTPERVAARRLARHAIEALVDAAVHIQPLSRESFLNDMLDRGVKLIGRQSAIRTP